MMETRPQMNARCSRGLARRYKEAVALLRECQKQKTRPHKGRLLPNALWKKINAFLAE